MLAYFVLGVALLVGILLAARWFAGTDAKTVLKVLKRISFGFLIGVIVFLAVTGRLGWAFMALPALLAWGLRLRALSRTAKNFSRMSAAMSGGKASKSGQTTDLETRYLRVSLDHDSGTMSGEVIEGSFAGRRLEDLGEFELVQLLSECSATDAQSAQVLEAYMDRVHPDWRQRAQADGEAGAAPRGDGPMTRDEAYQILGLDVGADIDAIKEAHRRLMAGLHPDHGGSTYLAAKLNQAKDLLLGK